MSKSLSFPFALLISENMAAEILRWALDEQAHWPQDTAFQRDLGSLIAQIKTKQAQSNERA